MADVQYKSEPTVSVHGVPQSEYNSQIGDQGGAGGGGISGHFKRHWVMYTLIIGAAGLVIMWLIYQQQNGGVASATGNSATGTTTNPSTIDGSWGAQLDADYQQLTSVETTNTGLLQAILNGITGANNPTNGTGGGGTTGTGTGSGSGSGTGGTGGGGVHLPSSAFTPIMGNTSIPHPFLGEHFSFEGIMMQLDPGPNNRIWEVPVIGGKFLTNDQLMNTPIGTGPGQKRLLTTGG